MYCKNLDARELLSRNSNCDEIKWESGPVDKEILLEKERALWNAAMEYRKVQNMDSEYDLVASKMTFFPILSNKCMWYHCNLVGCKRETPSKVMRQYFFLEINRTQGKTDTVTACIALDDDVDNTCNACPSHSGILHPCKGGSAPVSPPKPIKLKRQLAARVYDAAVWRFRRPRSDLNFQDVESLEEPEFLAAAPGLVNEEDRRRYHQAHHRIAIAERDEELMRQWKAQFLSDIDNTEAFFADLRAQRRSARRRRRATAEFELDNDPRWDDVWTEAKVKAV
ncbi:uncharacterized protein [Lolium perenne]|uniref:uncharacterized protein n=1 Tax=Lolium perenne TaxID=4522 RepID=UPI0021F5E9C3|nr:uncharacterized protein LOC127328598 [Lolium perenne]